MKITNIRCVPVACPRKRAFDGVTTTALGPAAVSDYTIVFVETDAGIATDGQRNVLISSKAFNIDPRLGIELGYQKMVWLRMGVGNFQRLKNEDDPLKKDLNFHVP